MTVEERDLALGELLNSELICALGCTEPIALAYAAALARLVLGCEPEQLAVGCSGNIIKNVKSVTVPNSGGMRGVEAAAVLGAVGGNAAAALETLGGVTDADIAHARELLGREGYVSVSLVEGVPNLYIEVRAEALGHVAEVAISEHHTNVVRCTRDGVPANQLCPAARAGADVEDACSGTCALMSAVTAQEAAREEGADAAQAAPVPGLSLDMILDYIEDGDVSYARASLERQLELNAAISAEGLENAWGAEVGRTLLATRGDDIACRARARAAAGSDARMSGCALPVAIVCGSGNQGITCALPVLTYAEELGVEGERLTRALALADLVAIHTKSYIGALSAFCGVVCAACGAGAAICWLRGGTREQIGATVVNTLGNVGGIVCDGAKASCAAKISAAVDAAILGCDMALAGRGFRAGEGIVQDTVEETIASMGYVGRVGMKDTDVEILKIMTGETRL
ncbi:MAG: serine dehydratase subunit alpha family protein [Collinsella stercoris]|uniref:L-cysteine desulfidase family protein n=1 Tax=Collinsella stercoris TaxID=147206 RepID=UPI0029779E03|nr:serine dehydratase subunit alpha family protein [Collinsella stercoris]